MIKLLRIKVAVLMLILLLSLTGCGKTADGKTHLTFQIWDVYQRPGMQAMCDAYTAQHPDVEIEVQATSWSEYWTKLEASAESNTMPDIFWMHTNQLLYYADFGMLADVTDLYDDVESDYYENIFRRFPAEMPVEVTVIYMVYRKIRIMVFWCIIRKCLMLPGFLTPPKNGLGKIWPSCRNVRIQ